MKSPEQYIPSAEEVKGAENMMTEQENESSEKRVAEIIKNLETNIGQMEEVLSKQKNAEEVTRKAIGFLPNDVASKGLERQLENLRKSLEEARKNSGQSLSPLEEVADSMGVSLGSMQAKLEAINTGTLEEQKEIAENWLEEVKSKDEQFNRENKQLADDFDVMINNAKEDGNLESFLLMKDMSIGTNFDEYMILNQPLEESIERYLENAKLIKRLVKVRNENGISASSCFGMLSDDISYFGRELIKKIRRWDVEEGQKTEAITKIEEMMKK